MTEATPVESKEQSRKENWGNTTDPRNHNPDNFRYLVYGINPMAKLTIPPVTLRELETAEGEAASLDTRKRQAVDLLAQPERLTERTTLSMSLIDQNHVGTWGSGGLILQVPTANILLTASEDLGAANWNVKHLRERSKKEPPMDAESLLQKTTPGGYNEVVATTQTEGGSIQLQGFFVKTGLDGNPISGTLSDEIKKQANILHLPVVFIREYSPYSEDKLIETDKRIEAQMGGRVYIFYLQPAYPANSEGRWEFRVFDQRSSRFMSPDEMEAALQFGLAKGLKFDSDEIRAKYAEADRERQKPKVEFDENGNVKNIRRRAGYKDNEEEFIINKHGALRKNLKQEVERISRAFYSTGEAIKIERNDYSQQGWSYLNPYEVKQLIDEAKRGMSAEEQDNLGKFALDIEEIVRKNWEYQLERSKR